MIKVEIEPSKYGYLLLYPVSRKVARRIAKSNQYDHCAAVFLDDPEHFLKRLSSSQKRNLNNGWKINILMDEWEYRHMVGGQSD